MPLNDDWTKGHLAVPAAVLFPQRSYARLCPPQNVAWAQRSVCFGHRSAQ